MLFDYLKLALYVIWTAQLAALPPLFLLVWWRDRRPAVAPPHLSRLRLPTNLID